MTLFWLIEALAGLTENIAGFLLVRDVLDVREKKYGQAGFCSIVLTVGLLLLNQVHLFLAFATLYGLAGITLCVCILYKRNRAIRLLLWAVILSCCIYWIFC